MRPKQSFKASNRGSTRPRSGCQLESCCGVTVDRQQRVSRNVRGRWGEVWQEIQVGGSLGFGNSGHNISTSTWLSIGVLASGWIGFVLACRPDCDSSLGLTQRHRQGSKSARCHSTPQSGRACRWRCGETSHRWLSERFRRSVACRYSIALVGRGFRLKLS